MLDCTDAGGGSTRSDHCDYRTCPAATQCTNGWIACNQPCKLPP
jgi:hypothetical protein